MPNESRGPHMMSEHQRTGVIAIRA